MQVICRYSYNHHFLKNIIYIYKNAVYRHFPFDKIFPVFWLPGLGDRYFRISLFTLQSILFMIMAKRFTYNA